MTIDINNFCKNVVSVTAYYVIYLPKSLFHHPQVKYRFYQSSVKVTCNCTCQFYDARVTLIVYQLVCLLDS